MLVISYTIKKWDEPYTVITHTGEKSNRISRYKKWIDIIFTFKTEEYTSDDEDIIPEIQNILDNNNRGRIYLIKKLLNEDKTVTYEFNDKNKECVINYNEDWSREIYIKINTYTDDMNCSSSRGSYYYTIPTQVAFNKHELEHGSYGPIIKYIYKDGNYVREE